MEFLEMVQMKCIKGLLAAGLLLCSVAAKAQFDVDFTNYWALNGYYNPAYAGQVDKLNICGTYSLQLAGFTNAPKTMYFGADMPLKFLNQKHGVGVGFMNETIGLLTNQRFFAQYSFKLNLWGGKLGIGVQLGGLSVGFDPEDLDLGEGENAQDDPAFPSAEANGTAFDMDLGLFYSHKLFYAGLSVAHLLAPKVLIGETNEMKVDPVYYLTGGCNIKTKNPLITIQPSVMLRTDMLMFKADLTARFLYTWNEKVYYAGVSYSPANSVALLIGMQLIKGLGVGYSYNMFTSKIGALNGSHDIYVNYSMDMNFMGKSKNKHKSIRIL